MSDIFARIAAFFGGLALRNVIPCIIILGAGYFGIKLIIQMFTKGLEKSKLDKSLHGFLTTALRILLVVLVLLIAASSLGIDVTSLIAVFSVASLAVSLAVQDSLANIAGGIMVLTSHPFTVGDYVAAGGSEGSVEKVGLAYTTLRTPDNKIVFIPNKDMASSRISNFSREGKRRVDLTFTASYDSPVDTVIAALTEAATVPALLEGETPFVKVSEYKESDIQYTVRVWVATADYWDTYFAIIANVKTVFDAKGVQMSYPHTVVHLEK